MDEQQLTGAELLLESLVDHGVETVFGYPGGQIVDVYDKMTPYLDRLNHILVRHEQGAIHAAQGYARAAHRTGVVIVTSGPGATNVVTGIADAMVDSTPVVVIAGQVATAKLGTDAFQETDLIGLTTPISKWAYQIRSAEDVQWAVSRAFYIASTGRPGPVVLDFTKTAQVGKAPKRTVKCDFIRSYNPLPQPSEESLKKAVELINLSQKPFVVFGQGIVLSGAEKQLEAFLDKGNMPAGSTLLGLSALPSSNPHFTGMVGMHGSLASNTLTQKADLIIAVGMRFSDRVTGKLQTYAQNAKIIHIDIDVSEIGKLVRVDVGIQGDAAYVLERLTKMMEKRQSNGWTNESVQCYDVEKEKVIAPEINPGSGYLHSGEVVARIAEKSGGNAVIVTDVGQNQMLAARYSEFKQSRSMITSGGLGTMGFGLPAAIGAKVALSDKRQVILFVGDGGIQMTIQELGTIMQNNIGVKIVVLNNSWLGMVRQWQELFYGENYSATYIMSPDYGKVAEAYSIDYSLATTREELSAGIDRMLSNDKPFILEARVEQKNLVFPMIAPGSSVDDILITPDESFEYGTK